GSRPRRTEGGPAARGADLFAAALPRQARRRPPAALRRMHRRRPRLPPRPQAADSRRVDPGGARRGRGPRGAAAAGRPGEGGTAGPSAPRRKVAGVRPGKAADGSDELAEDDGGTGTARGGSSDLPPLPGSAGGGAPAGTGSANLPPLPGTPGGSGAGGSDGPG